MAERYIPEHRRTQFKAKNSFKPDELRRRREEQQVEIRRAKREENLAKRRGVQRGNGEITIGGLTEPDSDDETANIENEVRLIDSVPPKRVLTGHAVEHRTSRNGERGLFGPDRCSDPSHHQVPKTPVQGAKPSYRKGHRDWRS
jgi:hypothetical protein